MMDGVSSDVIGKWRIVEDDTWESGYLDMLDPAYMAFDDKGNGEFTFGCVKGGMELEYSTRIIYFKWTGFDEMDEVSGDGSADLLDDGTLEIEFRFDSGDEVIMKARKW